jgi:hypothetical protein
MCDNNFKCRYTTVVITAMEQKSDHAKIFCVPKTYLKKSRPCDKVIDIWAVSDSVPTKILIFKIEFQCLHLYTIKELSWIVVTGSISLLKMQLFYN